MSRGYSNLFGSPISTANTYFSIIITKKNKVKLTIKIIESKEPLQSKLLFNCYFFKDYLKVSFQNTFSFDELKKGSLFYNQFTNINEVFKELYFNEKAGQEYIDGNENSDDKINVVIPITANKFPNLKYELNKVAKTDKELLEEYKNVVNIYKYKINISNFDSKILAIYPEDKELLKSWISPTKKIKAQLLYSFYVNCTKKNDKEFEIKKEDINKIGDIKTFHKNCDGKFSILVLCKSKDEIFGGYTPLSFGSQNDYGYDNKSFVFSINKKEKYRKNSYDKTESIWAYRDYGPCFHWDFYFIKYKMDTVEFEKKTYFTPDNWVNRQKCYFCYKGILLDSLEIYQIEINHNEEECESFIKL